MELNATETASPRASRKSSPRLPRVGRKARARAAAVVRGLLAPLPTRGQITPPEFERVLERIVHGGRRDLLGDFLNAVRMAQSHRGTAHQQFMVRQLFQHRLTVSSRSRVCIDLPLIDLVDDVVRYFERHKAPFDAMRFLVDALSCTPPHSMLRRDIARKLRDRTLSYAR